MLCISARKLFIMYIHIFNFPDPMVSLTAASFSVAESAGSTMDVCAEINNVLSPSGTPATITVDLLVTSGTASMSSQIPLVARHSRYFCLDVYNMSKGIY